MNIIIILIFVYLLFKYKSSKKEELAVYPSDISILMYDKMPLKIKKAELLFLPKDTKNDKYIKHNSNIYVKNTYKSFYEKNYGYESNQLYYNDFRWKYVDVYVTKELNDRSFNWIKYNGLASPSLYKIAYIHDDRLNRYNRSLKQYGKMNVHLIVCNINPYKCYKINNTYIVTNRSMNGDLIKSMDTTNAYIKLYIDQLKLVCTIYENGQVLHSFSIQNILTGLSKQVNLLEGRGKTQQPEHQMIGIPDSYNVFTKWKDPLFDKWVIYFLKVLKTKVDPSIDVNKLEIPTNHLNYLYIMNMNYKKEIDISHVVEQLITDLGLPIRDK